MRFLKFSSVLPMTIAAEVHSLRSGALSRALRIEKRFHQRKRLTGLLPGPLSRQSSSLVDCKPVDISELGLGIISADLLEVGEVLTLKTKDTRLELEVVWAKKDFGKQDLYRYGLVSIDPTQRITDIFQKSGCLK